MARSRRPGVKLPPSGKITNASSSSRPVARCADLLARSTRRPSGAGAMNRFGSRLSSTSIAGSHCRLSLSTIRGSRSNQLTSAWIRMNESPGPACRQSTSSGRPGSAVSGSVPTTSMLSRSVHRACQNSTRRNAAGQHVVRALEGRRPHPPAEAGGHPEHEEREQRGRVPDQVDACRSRAAAAAAAGRAPAARRPPRAAPRPAAWSPPPRASSTTPGASSSRRTHRGRQRHQRPRLQAGARRR